MMNMTQLTASIGGAWIRVRVANELLRSSSCPFFILESAALRVQHRLAPYGRLADVEWTVEQQ